MFVVLGLMISLDQLTLNAVQAIEPELRPTFHISSGAVVFIATASSLFYALGAIPLGWLADRMKRVPIVGFASLVAAFFTFLTGLAVSAFMFFWTVCLTGIAKANNIAVHPPLLADNYPIGIRARMSAVMNIGQQVLGNAEPGARRRDRGVGRRRRGLALGVRPASASRAIVLGDRRVFMIKEPPRGQFEKDDVLGEVDRGREPGAAVDGSRVRAAEEDRDDPHVDRRVRRARLRRVRARQPAGALPERHAARRPTSCTAASSSASPGFTAVPFLYPVGRVLRPHVPQGPGQGARARRRC